MDPLNLSENLLYFVTQYDCLLVSLSDISNKIQKLYTNMNILCPVLRVPTNHILLPAPCTHIHLLYVTPRTNIMQSPVPIKLHHCSRPSIQYLSDHTLTS